MVVCVEISGYVQAQIVAALFSSSTSDTTRGHLKQEYSNIYDGITYNKKPVVV